MDHDERAPTAASRRAKMNLTVVDIDETTTNYGRAQSSSPGDGATSHPSAVFSG